MHGINDHTRTHHYTSMSETEWRPTGNDSIGEMRGHVGVTRREDVKRSFVVRNYPTG